MSSRLLQKIKYESSVTQKGGFDNLIIHLVFQTSFKHTASHPLQMSSCFRCAWVTICYALDTYRKLNFRLEAAPVITPGKLNLFSSNGGLTAWEITLTLVLSSPTAHRAGAGNHSRLPAFPWPFLCVSTSWHQPCFFSATQGLDVAGLKA